MENKETFEWQLKRLEEIVELFDQDNRSIQEMLDLYEEGMLLAGKCRKFLETAEQKVIEINSASGTRTTEELNEYTEEVIDENDDDVTFEDYLPE